MPAPANNVKLSDVAYHCGVGLLVRLLFCVYGLVQDKYAAIPYTDVDYHVYTYAAKEVLRQQSPYEVRPFRYSPIVAYLCTPNLFLHPIFGKILSSTFDVCLGYCIYRIVRLAYHDEKKALQCAQLWLYNPVPVVICTRGNVDSLSSVCVLLTLLYHLRRKYLASGALLGLCVHLRLYPVVFLLPLFVTAGRFSAGDTFRATYRCKLKLAGAFAVSLAALTGAFYYLYGHEFVDASVLYHLRRRDSRHNFSLYFYLQYLDPFVPELTSTNFAVSEPTLAKNLLILAPHAVLQLALAAKCNVTKHLPFCLFCSAFVFVVFNKVLTAQYFVWFLSLLPLFLPSVVMSAKKVATVVGLWCGCQALWLFAAYLLEFRGLDTFAYVHASSVLFFLANVWILVTFINGYNARCFKKID